MYVDAATAEECARGWNLAEQSASVNSNSSNSNSNSSYSNSNSNSSICE